MFANYHYFLVLAEECNISRASERLYITHQNLSHYLSRLEEELGVVLFERKPVLSLTYEGKLLYDTLRQVETLEQNLHAQYADLHEDRGGEVRLGTTEGRFRILMPDLMSEFKKEYPDIQLSITSATSPELSEMVLNNRLDLAILGMPSKPNRMLSYTEVLQEKLYLVVSDNMLREQFGADYPACKEKLRGGADLHHMMSLRDYAASFCLTMYLPALLRLNEENGGVLNIFPIKDFTARNSVVVCCLQNRVLPNHTRALLRMIRKRCGQFSQYDLI